MIVKDKWKIVEMVDGQISEWVKMFWNLFEPRISVIDELKVPVFSFAA